MDLPKANGQLDRHSAKDLRQVVEKKLLQLAAAQATGLAVVNVPPGAA